MDEAEALRYCHEIVADAKAGKDPRASSTLRTSTLLDYLDLVADIVNDWTATRREETPWLTDFLTNISALRDDGETVVAADPVILYRPQHSVAEAFHASMAKYRLFWGGNRISKTIAGYVDDTWVATGRHPHRRQGMQGSVFIIGSDYQGYAPNVFEAKMYNGEVDNPLSPLFPEGGRWLHHYDKKHHILYVACADCARQWRAQQCPHTKYQIVLFSDRGKTGSIAGLQAAQGHLDEEVGVEFFEEAQQRISTVRESGLIVTLTAVTKGTNSWQYEKLYTLGIKGKPQNWLEDEGRPVVSLHTIDKLSAGLTPIDEIVAEMRTMTQQQIQARILGKWVNASDQAVFDLQTLALMQAECKDPIAQGDLIIKGESREKSIEEATAHAYDEGCEISFVEFETGNLRVWEPPRLGEQYVIGADVAFGLSRDSTKGDYSAAPIFKMTPVGSLMQFEQVASYRGLVDTFRYADALFRIGLWYNCAQMVVENNGPGMAVIQRLFETLGCWFLFRDVAAAAGIQMDLASTYGINTNIRSKTMLISVLQSLIIARRNGQPGIIVYDREIIEELQSYIQEPSKEGRTFILRGAGKSHDDWVMGCALGCYAGVASPLYDWNKAREQEKPKPKLTEIEQNIWRDVQRRDNIYENEEAWY